MFDLESTVLTLVRRETLKMVYKLPCQHELWLIENKVKENIITKPFKLVFIEFSQRKMSQQQHLRLNMTLSWFYHLTIPGKEHCCTLESGGQEA